ncbi:hypothetical protein OQJ13_02680 [Legionella sp. PATHC035]|uniref:hypothetical protein n=1 Tax=Legionella sp. PATHC035 TaxID=2992040 RepID=UPI002243817E|nr:hypothetical protein [Legionella sp. PATHC035]MCW8407873.1 hypothetical protein [Legionella sp. PATHC035]
MSHDPNPELMKVLYFMYTHADFFAAPFLGNNFSQWARTQIGMKKFSAQLHQALETSKPVALGDIDLIKEYRIAIVGAPVRRTGDFSMKNCLLAGNLAPLFKVLKSNPNLVQAIKSHMDSEFFDNWYSMQFPAIQAKRAHLLNQLEKFTQPLDHDFEMYQAEKLRAINSIDLPTGVFLHRHCGGHSASYYEDGHKKPAKITIENRGNKDISELQLLVDKFNCAQDARDALNDPTVNVFTRLNRFTELIENRAFIEKFTADNDQKAIRILKTVGYALTTLVFGLGIYLSYKNKKTWKFWKSEEQELLDSTKEHVDNSVYPTPKAST